MSSNLIARSVPRAARQPSLFAEVAQLVEHATENCGVGSSSLPLGTSLPFLAGRLIGRTAAFGAASWGSSPCPPAIRRRGELCHDSLRLLSILDDLIHGGHSSIGRAPGCGPGGYGFKSRWPPLATYFQCVRHLLLGAFCFITGGTTHFSPMPALLANGGGRHEC